MTISQRVGSIVSTINQLVVTVKKTVIDTELVSHVHELYMSAIPLIGDERLKPLLDALSGGENRTITSVGDVISTIDAVMTQVKFVNASKIVAGVSKALSSGDTSEISSACVNLSKASSMLSSNRGVKLDSMVISKESVKRMAPELKYDDTLRTNSVFDTWATTGSGELSVILAPPGVGKTTALVHIGRKIAQLRNGAVFHFSLEINRAALVTKYMDGWKDYNDEPIFVYYSPAGSVTLDVIKTRVESDAELSGVKPAVVIVDHLTHLATSASEKGSSKFDKISDNVIRMRAVGFELGCPVWTAMQPQRSPVRDMRSVPSRGGAGYCLGMQDVAECWAVPQVADNLYTINQTDDERDSIPIKARVHNAKTRKPRPNCTPRHTIDVTIDYGKCDFVSDGKLF